MLPNTLAISSGTQSKALDLFFSYKANYLILGYTLFMPLRSLMKNPMLVVGVLMMMIFLFQAGKKFNWWESRRQKLMPSSCKAVLVKLERRIPENWQTSCEGKIFNNLAVEINYPVLEKQEKQKDQAKSNKDRVRSLLYREMANDLISIAKNSPSDNLEKTDIVRIKLIHPEMTINAVTEGKYIVKLQTLRDKRLIAEHLKVTVQVQETLPEKKN
ncbi:MAG: hypothetical protein CME63_03665 [Halobacteriovoraceae bacterium]|nr:hypothetical protein [Halobacteriovoraceae bacterium]MBC96820.1 hypothetical protein [Halobacteriovoraceae bacterium]